MALAVFAGAYVGLSLGRLPPFRVDRTGVAIAGAAAMVVTGALPWNEAVAAVDANTLLLLFGMMIVAAYLRLSGFFGLVTTWAVRRATTPSGVLVAIVAASGALSALFVNDVICLVLAPLVIAITRRLRLPAVPYLIALATAANVGSMATLTGNPQNMLVGSFSGIGYRRFLLREAPVAVVGLACVFVVIRLVYRRTWASALAGDAGEPASAVHYPLMTKTVPAVLLFKTVMPKLADPERAWLVLGMASTLAGNLTLVGSVANLIVAESARAAGIRIGLREYCRVGVPLTIVTLLLGWLVLR